MEDGVRVLEAIGVENFNTDGAAFNYYIASGRDMIVAGVGRECIVEKIGDYTVEIAPGELIIHGFRIRVDKAKQFTVPSDVSNTQYLILATIELHEDKTVDFSWSLASGAPGLQQDHLFTNNVGKYQIKLAGFSAGLATPIGTISQKLKVGYAIGSTDKKLDCPTTPHASLWTIPRIKPGTVDEIQYIGSTQGAGGSTVAIRDPDGSLRAAYNKDGEYTTDDTLINRAALNAALALLPGPTKIKAIYASVGTSITNAIDTDEYGLFAIKGGSGTQISLAGTTVTTGLMVIFKYKVGDSRRVMYFYQGAVSIMSGEAENPNLIGVYAAGTTGARIVKISLQI